MNTSHYIDDTMGIYETRALCEVLPVGELVVLSDSVSEQMSSQGLPYYIR